MAKKSDVDEHPDAKYEFRVWGQHRRARKLIAKLATSESRETVEDCYLLVDDLSWNAKVRDNTLKIKQLVEERKGFEGWVSDRHRSADSAPSPFDDLFDDLHLDRPQRGKSYDLAKAVEKLGPGYGVRAVFVTKYRRRYRIGGLRAEVTDIEIGETGQQLQTISIEGDDLGELSALRKKLGLKSEPNMAVHEAIDHETD